MSSITYLHRTDYSEAIDYEFERRERLDQEFNKILGEWDMVCDAFSCDGISYPGRIEYLKDGIEKHIEKQKYMEDYYMQLSHLIRDRDAAAIGQIVMANAIAYLQDLAQDRAELS